jgi:hypothetical protein
MTTFGESFGDQKGFHCRKFISCRDSVREGHQIAVDPVADVLVVSCRTRDVPFSQVRGTLTGVATKDSWERADFSPEVFTQVDTGVQASGTMPTISILW